jgi:FAD/FMN-containing dehydrogenase
MKRVFKIFLALCFLACGAYLFSEPLYTPTALSSLAHQASFPKYTAYHAVMSTSSRGNTLEAIQEVLASPVEGIEIDIAVSEDGVPFLLTDQSAEASKPIPLEEVLNLVQSQKYLVLNIKTFPVFDQKFAQRLSKIIRDHHLQETVIVSSFNPLFLLQIRLEARDILLMYNFTENQYSGISEKMPWIFRHSFFQKQMRRLIRPDLLGVPWNLEENFLKSLIAQGYPLISEIVEDVAVARRLFDLGIKGIQTRDPLKLMEGMSGNPQTIYDAGGSIGKIERIAHIKSIEDIVKTLQLAKRTGTKITIAGRRHSMGGQTLLDHSIHLNMLGLNHVNYNPLTQTVTVGAGATWKKIQTILAEQGRSIKVMQSDNIFCVGGSLSANVHGWQVGAPPIDSTVISLKVVTADSTVLYIRKTAEPELFKAIMGGYGQFAVIAEVELVTVPNSMLKFQAQFLHPKDFSKEFKRHIAKNPKVELAYGRLSVDQTDLFGEAGLFWYEKVGDSTETEIIPESMVALKRGIFRSSQYGDFGKKVRWAAEKIYAKKAVAGPPVSRTNAMNTDIHVLWPLYGDNKDILHEYFVPKNKLADFLEELKRLIKTHEMNILNLTIREVQKDKLSLLPYATQDVFGLVLLFSQKKTPEDEKKMKTFTGEVIDAVLKLKGTFYLPYRLHYTKEQLLKAYPGVPKWIEVKKKWDPNQLFDSQFFRHLSSLLA